MLPISTIYIPGLENSHEQRAFPYHAKLECAQDVEKEKMSTTGGHAAKNKLFLREYSWCSALALIVERRGQKFTQRIQKRNELGTQRPRVQQVEY